VGYTLNAACAKLQDEDDARGHEPVKQILAREQRDDVQSDSLADEA